MNVSGFSFWYPMLMSLTIFAGSAEFVAANLLLGAFHPLQALVMTLMINARHLFYGISMLKRFRGTGWKKFYLIFGMCDESFSINYTAKIPEDIDRGWFMFSVTLFNHLYWFCGAMLGAVFGSLVRFNTEGLEFVMTAMFVVIFYGAVAEREEPWQLTGGTGTFSALPVRLRRGKFYHSFYAGDSRRADATPEAVGERNRQEGGRRKMTLSQQLIIIGMVVLGTMITRFLPFLIFPSGRPVPKYVQYLGNVIPSAAFGLLVIYSLKDVSFLTGNHGLPEMISVFRGRGASCMETEDDFIRRRRYSMLYAARAARLLIERKK